MDERNSKRVKYEQPQLVKKGNIKEITFWSSDWSCSVDCNNHDDGGYDGGYGGYR